MSTVSQISRLNASHIEHDTQKKNAEGSCREAKHESGDVKQIIASSSVQNRKVQCTIKVKPNDLLSACIIAYIYTVLCAASKRRRGSETTSMSHADCLSITVVSEAFYDCFLSGSWWSRYFLDCVM